MGDNQWTTGRLLRRLRRRYQTSQGLLASKVGMAAGVISAIELDRLPPDPEDLKKIADYFRVDTRLLERPQDFDVSHELKVIRIKKRKHFNRTPLAERLCEARKAKGLSQKEVSGKTGIYRETLSLFETGHRDPHAKDLVKLANLYGVTTDFILGRTLEDVTAQAVKIEAQGWQRRLQLEQVQAWKYKKLWQNTEKENERLRDVLASVMSCKKESLCPNCRGYMQEVFQDGDELAENESNASGNTK